MTSCAFCGVTPDLVREGWYSSRRDLKAIVFSDIWHLFDKLFTKIVYAGNSRLKEREKLPNLEEFLVLVEGDDVGAPDYNCGI
jgi:hypothetical protein